MTVFEKGLITVLAVAGILALLALPLALRKVPPNVIYGFRTRATLEDGPLWFEANAHFGRGLLLASLAGATAIVVLYGAELSPQSFLNASLACLALPPLAAVLATLRYIRRLTLGGPDEPN